MQSAKYLQLKQKTASKGKPSLHYLAAIENIIGLPHTGKPVTTVTIPERIMINEDVKIPRSSLLFSLAKTPQKNCASRISLRRSTGAPRGPLQRGARLEAIGLIGQRPALTMDQIILETEPELEPKTLDAWSQSRSLKF